MTVLEYVSQNEIQDFYCITSTKIVLIHTHRSRKGKETKISELFGRRNLCHLKDWNKYQSFNSFANKEIEKIEKDYRNIPIIYVKFTNSDWQEEIKNIFTENKRNFNYYIDSEISSII